MSDEVGLPDVAPFLEKAARERARVVETARKLFKGAAPKVGVRKLPRRMLARAVQQHAALTAETVAEQMARGALFDPRDFYYAEAGEELYRTDGPLVADALGNLEPAWKAGEVKRAWSAGDLKPMHELTEAQAQCITQVEVVMKNAVAGDGQIDRVLKYRFAPREKYVELAARHHGMLVDRVESNVNVTIVGSKLDEARATWARLQDIEAKALPEPEG